MPLKTGKDPAQFGQFATPIEAMIAEDNEVRVIAAFVDRLDLPALGFKMAGNTGASGPGDIPTTYYKAKRRSTASGR